MDALVLFIWKPLPRLQVSQLSLCPIQPFPKRKEVRSIQSEKYSILKHCSPLLIPKHNESLNVYFIFHASFLLFLLLFAIGIHSQYIYIYIYAAAEQFNVERFTNDAMEVINDPLVDAVWICSPSQYHAEQIKACAAAGKHVFCEKPIATDLPETVEAINACNEAGVKLMIGLQRRFDQNFLRVKNAITNKEVGESIMVRQKWLLPI